MKLKGKQFWPSLLADLLLLSLLLSYTSTAAAQTAGTFIPTGSMTTPRIDLKATLLLTGKVLITGGRDEWPASAELYDPVTSTFTATGNMTTGRSSHSATLLSDGRVLIAGGRSSASAYLAPGLGTAELYDPSNGTFTATGNMVTPQFGTITSSLDNGKVLITGGVAWSAMSANCCFTAANPELYDPSTGAFTAAGEYVLAGPRQNPYGSGEWGMVEVPTIVLPNGKVLVAGEPCAELYDVMTGTFSLTGAMTTHHYGDRGPWYIAGRTATLLTNGRVLVGGGTHEDIGVFADAELYDPSTGRFTAIGNMTRTRTDHTATLLRDGTVLIAGSQTSPGVTASTELYDPAAGTFTATADMISPRFRHTATLLMDGRILMTGGYTSYPASPNSSAELYVPSVLVPAQVVIDAQLSRTIMAAGGSYSVNFSGSNLTPETFFDVRFTAPGSNASAVVLNWQRGLAASHDVVALIASGTWTINGVRAHKIDTDHTGSFFPVSATITVSP